MSHIDAITLKTFVTVAEAGSMTGAAEALGRSQSTISRVIQDLEGQFGFALLSRQGRNAQLTREGLVFEQEARRLLASFEELDYQIKEIARGEKRSFGFASTAAINNGLVPEVINGLPPETLPNEIEMAQFLPDVVAHEVRAGRSDLGLCSLPVDLRGLRVLRGFSSQVVVALREEDPLARHDTLPLEALCERRVVTLLRRLPVPQLVARAMGERGIRPKQIFRTNVSYSALQMVARADAVAIVDPVSAYCIPMSGVVIRPLDIDLNFIWGAVVNENFPLRSITATMVERLEQVARTHIPDLCVHAPDEIADILGANIAKPAVKDLPQ